jgi:hypothetical protein
MKSNGYRLLGLLVWRGGRWYLRRRMPARRTLLSGGLLAAAALIAVGLLARRAAG